MNQHQHDISNIDYRLFTGAESACGRSSAVLE